MVLAVLENMIPSFSSKRGHVTVKHVLTGHKHDKLGNQTFEVLQPLKRTVHTIPLTYFTYWSSSRHLNYSISEILGQNTWFEVSAVFVYRKHRKLSNFDVKVCLTAVEIQMFGYQACHVCAQLEHVFSVTCPHLDENDGCLAKNGCCQRRGCDGGTRSFNGRV